MLSTTGLALLPETHDKMHGEKVAFGLLTQLVLEGKPMGEWDAVLAFLKNAHLPVTFADLGLNQPAAEDLLKVGELAASPKQFSKNLRSASRPKISLKPCRKPMLQDRRFRNYTEKYKINTHNR